MIYSNKNKYSGITTIVNELSKPESYNKVYHRPKHDENMPSAERLKQIVEMLREVIFPGYFGNSAVTPENMNFYLGVNIDKIYHLLSEEINRGLCFDCILAEESCDNCRGSAWDLALSFVQKLPELRKTLQTDVIAMYEGDPAAKSYGEIIYCYPGLRAITNYRIAHELLRLNIPIIPRIISEMAHSETGIDIHPGASIGEYFSIDHGTGVVIGETCVIGKNVKLYQGVTLGAKSFPLDENGNPIKGIPRHPIVEDNVVIYSSATILGRITIGEGSVIGGNIWVLHDVPPNTKMVQKKPKESFFNDGGGI